MINPNWCKWIYSSINAYFTTLDGFMEWHSYLSNPIEGTIPVYVGGSQFDPEIAKQYIEIRLLGPTISELSKNNYKIYVTINVLLDCLDSNNLYLAQTILGKIQSAMGTIPLFRYGGDDETFVGCLRPTRYSKIVTTDYGSAELDNKHRQYTVECEYSIEIHE